MGKDKRDADPSHCISVKVTVLQSWYVAACYPPARRGSLANHNAVLDARTRGRKHGCRAIRPQIWLSREL